MLEVEGLRIELAGRGVDIVDGVSFALAPGEVLGLVGESGSGKTTVGLALLGHTRRGAEVAAGEVRIEGRDVLKLPVRELRSLRGRVVSYVPQDPSSALNPSLRIGTQLMEVLEAHRFGASGAERRERLREMLAEVLLPSDDAYLRRYPHQLSGGQQQRVGLAMAFACRPPVIVLDEPTTGLDVTTQAHVLDHRPPALPDPPRRGAVREPRPGRGRRAGHPGGRDVRRADGRGRAARRDLPRGGPPVHPAAAARDPRPRRGEHALVGIPGVAPRPGDRPNGCFFAPRCDFAVDPCHEAFPPVDHVAAGHDVRCFRADEVRATSLRERLGRAAGAAGARGRGPALGGARPRRLLRRPPGPVRGEPRAAAARVPGPGRRVRLGQDDAGPLHRRPAPRVDRPGAAARPPAGPGGPAARPRDPPPDPVHLPEPVQLAEPAKDDRADRGPAAAGVLRPEPPERDGRVVETLEKVSLLELGRRPLSRPALGRRAPAGGHRPGPGGRAGRAGVRRDHLGARRVGAGGDRRAAGGAAAGVPARAPVRDPQPGPDPDDGPAGGGHV